MNLNEQLNAAFDGETIVDDPPRTALDIALDESEPEINRILAALAMLVEAQLEQNLTQNRILTALHDLERTLRP